MERASINMMAEARAESTPTLAMNFDLFFCIIHTPYLQYNRVSEAGMPRVRTMP